MGSALSWDEDEESLQMKDVQEKMDKQVPTWCGCSWDGTVSPVLSRHGPVVLGHAAFATKQLSRRGRPGLGCTSTGLWWHQHPEATSSSFWTRTSTAAPQALLTPPSEGTRRWLPQLEINCLY